MPGQGAGPTSPRDLEHRQPRRPGATAAGRRPPADRRAARLVRPRRRPGGPRRLERASRRASPPSARVPAALLGRGWKRGASRLRLRQREGDPAREGRRDRDSARRDPPYPPARDRPGLRRLRPQPLPRRLPSRRARLPARQRPPVLRVRQGPDQQARHEPAGARGLRGRPLGRPPPHEPLRRHAEHHRARRLQPAEDRPSRSDLRGPDAARPTSARPLDQGRLEPRRRSLLRPARLLPSGRHGTSARRVGRGVRLRRRRLLDPLAADTRDEADALLRLPALLPLGPPDPVVGASARDPAASSLARTRV